MKNKNIKKWLSITIASFSVFFTLACTSACTNPSGPSSSDVPSSESQQDGNKDKVYYIKANNDNVDLLKGDEFTLEPALYCGLLKIDIEKFTFESLNSSIATIDANGKIKAVGTGSTKIRISANGYDDALLFVDVFCHADLTLDISKTAVELAKVEKFGYSNQVKLSYSVKSKEENITDAQISLSCSNSNVTASVEGTDIVITAHELGTTFVTASYTDGVETVETRIDVNVVKPILLTEETYLFSTCGDKTVDMTLIEALEGESCSTADLVSVTYESGEFSFEKETSSKLVLTDPEALGEWGVSTPVTFEFSGYEIQLKLKGYTHVIRSAQDFVDMEQFLKDTTIPNNDNTGYCKIIEGNYILANDIDFNDYYQKYNTTYYASPFGHASVGFVYAGYTHGWNATFDGNGHQIKNLVIGKTESNWCNSLFGIINGNKGIIKNVAFVNAGLAEGQNLRGCAFLANYIWGAVENVYIDVSLPTNGTTLQTAIGSYENYALCADAEWQVVKDTTIILRSSLASSVVNKDHTVWLNNKTTVSKTFENTVLIGGGEEKQIVGGDIKGPQTASEILLDDGSVKVYDSVATASKDTMLKKNGAATFEVDNEMFTVYWNGVLVYKAGTKVQIKLETQLYSLDDRLIDLTGINGEIFSITRGGVSVQYTLDGNKAAISQDEILNAQVSTAQGEIVNVLIETASAIYTLPLKVCSDVIDSSIEFAEMSKFITTVPTDAAKQIIEGYYILSQNIDFNDYYTANSTTFYTSPFSARAMGDADSAGYLYGWGATFDGNGYQIKNLTLGVPENSWTLSLFGMIKGGGIVQNVAFVNAKILCDDNNPMRESAFLATAVYGRVENVYIDIDLTTTNSYMDSAIRVAANWAVVNNLTVVVRNPISSGENNTNYIVHTNNADAIKSLNNAVLINNGAENQIANNYVSVSAIQTANNTVKAYANIASAANDGTLTSNGSVSFGKSGDTYTIYWNGTAVYSYALN